VCNPRGVDGGVRIRRLQGGFQCFVLHSRPTALRTATLEIGVAPIFTISRAQEVLIVAEGSR
jgi:hypothetical protein